MATYLLTWNPDRWTWTDLPNQVAALERGETVADKWSTGNRTHVSPGDRLFLLRQGRDPRGIMASGMATSDVFQREHWDRERAAAGKPANIVELRFDVLIDPDQNPEGVLLLDDLQSGVLAEVNWRPQASGTEIPPQAARRLEQLWWQHHGRLIGEYRPGEIAEATRFAEGAVRTVYVDTHERSLGARTACIDRWGTKCAVCGFDFEVTYGERGAGFIEVHHLKPIAEVGEQYEVDAILGLRPVCSNCHAMLHRCEPMLTPEELQHLLQQT